MLAEFSGDRSRDLVVFSSDTVLVISIDLMSLELHSASPHQNRR